MAVLYLHDVRLLNNEGRLICGGPIIPYVSPPADYMKPTMTENDYLNRQVEKLRKMRGKRK